jgi:hypothetical protein
MNDSDSAIVVTKEVRTPESGKFEDIFSYVDMVLVKELERSFFLTLIQVSGRTATEEINEQIGVVPEIAFHESLHIAPCISGVGSGNP